MTDGYEEKDDTKRKSRNLSEKKRRDQFNILINELCSMVSSTSRKLDKSSVLRSTISFLRTHSEVSVKSQESEVQENWKPSFLSNEEFTHLMLEALDGFIIVLSCHGKILYTSESITSLLGYLPSDLGISIFDIIHDGDKQALYKLLHSIPLPFTTHRIHSKGSFLSLLVHMKHGPVHFSSSPTYELVRLIGNFHHWNSSPMDGRNATNINYNKSCNTNCSHTTGNMEGQLCFVAMARLQTPQLLREMTLLDGSKNEFTSRHSLEWKFLFLDHRAPPIIGYLPFEVLGTSGYDYYHVDDLEKVALCHESLMQTGEGTSCHYRFLTKGQQWIWLQTRYYITYHQWNSKPEFIVCTHSVVSHKKVLTRSNNGSPLSKSDYLIKLEQPKGTVLSPWKSNSQSPTLSPSSKDSLSSGYSDKSSVASSNVLATSQLTKLPKILPRNADDQSDNCTYLPTKNSICNQRPISINSKSSCNSPTPSQTATVTVTALHPTNEVREVPVLKCNENAIAQQSNDNIEGNQLPFISSGQSELQDYLRRRHQLLQQQILMQQEELRRVSEQLMLVQFVTPSQTTTVPCQPSNSSMFTVSTTSSPHIQTEQLMSPLIQCHEDNMISKHVMPSEASVNDTIGMLNFQSSSQLQEAMSLQLPLNEQAQMYSQDFSLPHESLQQNT